MTTKSDSSLSIGEEAFNPEKSPIPGDEFAQDSLKIVSLPPVESDSVGEINLTKQVESSSPFTSISEIDPSVSSSETSSMIFKETEAMDVEDGVVSVAGTVSASLEVEMVDRKLQQIEEASAPNVSVSGSCSEISKEGEQFGDDMHKMDEGDDTDGSFLPISEIQPDFIAPNGKESLNSEEKDQESEAQRLLEAEKRRLLAEIEIGTIFGKSADEDTFPTSSEFHKIEKNGSKELHKTVMERVGVMDIAAVKRSVKIELIDDTAMVDVVPCYKKGNNHPKRPGTAHAEKDAPRKHKKKTGEKPIGGKEDKGNASKAVEGNASAKVSEFHNRGGETNGNQVKKMYSRKQMESMRFAKIVNQRKLWSEMYAGLVPEVLTEYEGLVCSKSQKSAKSNHVRGQPIHGQNMDSEEGTEEQDYADDNDDYGSILRPAFAVDGEPDFDSGPPEDGLEYLRRVRWEAKGIPNVRVAKIDETKYIKKEQSVYMPQIPEIPKCPEHLLPLKEWEDSLLSDFLLLRQALSQEEANEYEEDEMMISSESVEDVFIDMFNKCLYTERDETLSGMLSEIQGMDSVTRVSKLKKRIGLVEKESGLQSSDCKWVVALCASLETPLDADTCACLRGLLRKCASVRAEKSLEEVDEVIVMTNMLITIAGRYFGQMGQ